MRPYATLGQINGQPLGLGIERDYEVPDNYVVASPGGVSATQHHYTHGFYGHGDVQTDRWGYSDYQYPYGISGNLYQVGHSAAPHMGMYPQSHDNQYWNKQNPPTPVIDNFEMIEPIEIETPATELYTNESRMASESPFRITTITALLLFLLAFIAFVFLSNTGEKFLRDRFHGGKEIKWQWMLFYSIVLVTIFLIAAFIAKVPLASFETL